MTSDSVRRVVLAYEQCARRAAGNKFLVTEMPKEGSKSYKNCLEVYEWCGGRQVELHQYFEKVFERFNPDWCLRNFKRKWPPFGVASSLKVLLRIEAGMTAASPMRDAMGRMVEEVAGTIRKHPQRNWNVILENVYGYLPFELKRAVRLNLNQGSI